MSSRAPAKKASSATSATSSTKKSAPSTKKPVVVEKVVDLGEEDEWSSEEEDVPDSEDEAFIDNTSDLNEDEELELAKVLIGFRKRHYQEQGVYGIKDE